MPETNNDDLQLQYQQILQKYSNSVKPPLVSTPASSPKNSSISGYKLFFYFSLVVFLTVLAMIVRSFLVIQQSDTSPNKSISPTPLPVCQVNQHRYLVGQSFPSPDGCNTCSCTPDLTIVCTEKSCLPTPTPEPQKTYQNKVFNFSINYPQSYKISDKLPTKFTEISRPVEILTLTNVKTGTSITIHLNADGFGPVFPNETGTLTYSPSSGTIISDFSNPDISDYQSRNPDSLKYFTGQYSGKIGDNNFLIFTKYPLPDDFQNRIVLDRIINSLSP